MQPRFKKFEKKEVRGWVRLLLFIVRRGLVFVIRTMVPVPFPLSAFHRYGIDLFHVK